MKSVDDNLPGGNQPRFDLLVDGELSEAERRELLSALDDEPGGWRQCALAFLEAQCWKQELGALVRPPQSQPAVSRAAPQAARRSRPFGRHGTLLAMAASFLAAMFLSSYAQRVWHNGGNPPGDTIAGGRGNAAAEFAPLRSQGLELAGGRQAEAKPGRWETVTLSMPEGPQGGRESIDLPVVERDNIDDAWLRSFPAAMPPDVLQALERTGHRIQQHRDLLPIPMNDGRRLVVPVDQVEVHYVGNPTY